MQSPKKFNIQLLPRSQTRNTKPERLIRLGVFAAVDSKEFMVGKLVRVYDECLGTDRR